MKKILFKSILLAFLAVWLGCQNTDNLNDPDNQIHGSGRIVSETRVVDECQGIIIKNLGKVYLIQSDEQSIKIEADDNIIGSVLTYKENGSLLVGLPNESYSNVTLRIYVSLKSIENILIEGAGDVECLQPINSENLFCSITGAGNISLDGNGDYLNCIINGAGNIYAKQFVAKNCSAVVNGAGKCTINVSENLDAVVSGVGSIIYYGNPENIKSSISGLGEIKAGL